MKTTADYQLGLIHRKDGFSLSTLLRPERRRASWGPVDEAALVSRLVSACEELRTTHLHFGITGLRLPELLFGVKSGPWRNVTLRTEPDGKAVSIEKYIEHCVGNIESFLNRHPEFERVDSHNEEEKRWRLHVQFTATEKNLLEEAMVLDLPSKRNLTPKRTHTFGRASRFKGSRGGIMASHRNPHNSWTDAETALSATTVAGANADNRLSTATAPGFYSSQAFATPRRCQSDMIFHRKAKKPVKPTMSQHLSSVSFQAFCERQAEHAKSRADFTARTRRQMEAAWGSPLVSPRACRRSPRKQENPPSHKLPAAPTPPCDAVLPDGPIHPTASPKAHASSLAAPPCLTDTTPVAHDKQTPNTQKTRHDRAEHSETTEPVLTNGEFTACVFRERRSDASPDASNVQRAVVTPSTPQDATPSR
eukprot:GEMP01029372.1.p1 GENE.GEMP01029372.1~~GEMP01029372.1.p1  ORF type:complete len:421 (+),score=108.81 GEMP01029372.1:73-1335(+)